MKIEPGVTIYDEKMYIGQFDNPVLHFATEATIEVDLFDTHGEKFFEKQLSGSGLMKFDRPSTNEIRLLVTGVSSRQTVFPPIVKIYNLE